MTKCRCRFIQVWWVIELAKIKVTFYSASGAHINAQLKQAALLFAAHCISHNGQMLPADAEPIALIPIPIPKPRVSSVFLSAFIFIFYSCYM